jgi:hypothetical protein
METQKAKEEMSVIGPLIMLAIAILFVLYSANTLERLLYLHGSTYPKWAATGTLTSGDTVYGLRYGQCKDIGPVEIKRKDHGAFVYRCGEFYFESKTFLADFELPTR